jgi:predicted aspartyl protease
LRSFSFSFADLVTAGPLIQVHVATSRDFARAVGPTFRAAPPVSVTALIDTGAQCTVLNPAVVEELALKPVGLVSVMTPTGSDVVSCRQFHISVHFSPELVIDNILAAEAPLIGHAFQCLIGRDVLRSGTLVYAGSENKFTITF